MTVEEHVAALAAEHGVTGERTAMDELADVLTRLSCDDVETDTTEDLIIALRRARVIDGPTMLDLLHRHLDEIYGTESVVAAGDLREDGGIDEDGGGHGPCA